MKQHHIELYVTSIGSLRLALEAAKEHGAVIVCYAFDQTGATITLECSDVMLPAVIVAMREAAGM